jgi:hypothetical protein
MQRRPTITDCALFLNREWNHNALIRTSVAAWRGVAAHATGISQTRPLSLPRRERIFRFLFFLFLGLRRLKQLSTAATALDPY